MIFLKREISYYERLNDFGQIAQVKHLQKGRIKPQPFHNQNIRRLHRIWQDQISGLGLVVMWIRDLKERVTSLGGIQA